MKTQRQRACLLFGWILRRSLCDGGPVIGRLVLKTTLKISVVQSRFCKQTTLLIGLVDWTHLRENITVPVESISII